MSSLALRRAQSRHPDQWGDDNYDVCDDGSFVGCIFRVDDASESRVHDDAETWIWSVDVSFSPDSPWGRVGSLKEAKTAFQREYARLLRSQRHESIARKEPTNTAKTMAATRRSSGAERATRFTLNKFSIAILSAAAVAAALAILVWSYWPSGYLVVCLPSNSMSAADRQPYEAAALAIANNMVRGNLTEAYSQVSADAKKVIPPSQFAGLRQASGESMTTLTSLRVTQTYFLRSVAGSERNVLVPCPAMATTGISKAEGQVFVGMKTGGEQAHVIVEGDDGKHNIWNFVFWLILEDDVWRMQALHFGPVMMLGKSVSDYWADARDQQRLGHMFSAAMLYTAADSIAFKGRNFQTGIWREIRTDAKNLSVPPELMGALPHQWKFGIDSYRVLQVMPFFAGGETDLTVKVEVPSVGDTKATDESNHGLIRHLVGAYPELLDSFQAIVVEAVEPGSGVVRSYRTVQYGRKGPQSAAGN